MATEAPTVTANTPTATGIESVSLSNGFEIHSNTTKAEDIKSNLNAKDKTQEAASTLGKKSAEKRQLKPTKAFEPKAKPETVKTDTQPVEAPADAPVEEEAPEVEAAEKKRGEGNPRHDAQARIRELAAEREAARQEAAEYRQRLESLERGRQAPAVERADNGGEPGFDWRIPPNEEEYAAKGLTYGQFLQDTVDHRLAMQAEEQYQHQERERHAQTFHKNVETKLETFKERLTEQFEGIPEADVSDLISKCSFTLPPGARPHQVNVIADTMVLHCENPGRMEQYFRTDEGREELQRIASLQTPTAIQLALAKVDYRVGSAATTSNPAPSKAKSEAKPPFRLVNGSPSTPSPNEASESFEQRMARKYPGRRA